MFFAGFSLPINNKQVMMPKLADREAVPRNPKVEVWTPNRARRPLRGILGTRKDTYRVYSRYMRIPELRAHARGPWFQP